MTDAEIALMVAILAIGLPSMPRNRTALALVGLWLFGYMRYELTGRWDVEVCFIADLFALAIICSKPAVYPCEPYRNVWRQFCAMWTERSWWDRFIIATFPAMWFFYFGPVTDSEQWWGLWWLALVQIFAAGSDTLITWLESRAANAADEADLPPDTPQSGVEFAWAQGNRGYG